MVSSEAFYGYHPNIKEMPYKLSNQGFWGYPSDDKLFQNFVRYLKCIWQLTR